ncbi:MAG TPA: hypothetical protein VGQ00_02465 [Candidatus Norongarragalinales archaeon]|jgi:hypothetical protein|nr:hypothetical protein [Candidatus Norongarragalinales archaeon]
MRIEKAFLLFAIAFSAMAAATECQDIDPTVNNFTATLGYSQTFEEPFEVVLSPYPGTFPFECAIDFSLETPNNFPWLNVDVMPPNASVGGQGIPKNFVFRAQTFGAPITTNFTSALIIHDTGNANNTRRLPIKIYIQGRETTTPTPTQAPTPIPTAEATPIPTPAPFLGPPVKLPFLGETPPSYLAIGIIILVIIGGALAFFIFGRTEQEI